MRALPGFPHCMASNRETASLHDRAYAAMDDGALAAAAVHFRELIRVQPDNRNYHYMLGLAHKYLRDWPASLRHNLRAIELCGAEGDEAADWNAAIAATAIGDWREVRRSWSRRGIPIPEGEGPIDHDFGLAVVRLNPWSGGETVFARRIDPVRARLLNVPLPESGHRFGDIVLHDGASTGHRLFRDRRISVFNELERLVPSAFRTFPVFVHCADKESLQSLLDATAPGVGHVEDWTDTVHSLCMRCSYGAPHRHVDVAEKGWDADRNLGIAAQDRASVEKMLRDWMRTGKGRGIDAIESRECDVPPVVVGHDWWSGHAKDDATEAG